MGLKDEVLAEQAGASRGGVEKILEELSDEDAAELRELLADPLVLGTSIHRVLKSRGFEIGERTIQRYRRELI